MMQSECHCVNDCETHQDRLTLAGIEVELSIQEPVVFCLDDHYGHCCGDDWTQETWSLFHLDDEEGSQLCPHSEFSDGGCLHYWQSLCHHCHRHCSLTLETDRNPDSCYNQGWDPSHSWESGVCLQSVDIRHPSALLTRTVMPLLAAIPLYNCTLICAASSPCLLGPLWTAVQHSKLPVITSQCWQCTQ